MIIGIDLETTGLDNMKDSILEIALVKFDEQTFEIIETFSTVINPQVEIPIFISNLTNIFESDIKDAPKWGDIEDEVRLFIGDTPLLGHNTKFDSGFLRSNGIELRNNIEIDTFEFANFLLLEERSLSLEALSLSLGIDLVGAHRALNDTLATIKLFEILVSKMKKMSTIQLGFIEYITKESKDTGIRFVYNNLLNIKIVEQSDDIFLKNLLKTLSKKSSTTHRNINSELEEGNLQDFISQHKSLELRENQYSMSCSISEAFKNEEKIVIEAPTGVGKTFAYLLPSILHSVKTGEQVYISTSTKALQDQIFYKDLEFLSKELETEFSYTKLKGKANYIGILAFINFIGGSGTFTRGEESFVLKILFWLIKTDSGELDELDFYGKEYFFVSEINADDLGTFSKENTFEQYEFCVNARKRSKKANIVIINNNILFQDIEGDNNILGKIENLVLDEAHTLEDVVTQSLKKGFGLQDFEKHLVLIDKILTAHKSPLEDVSKKIDILIFEMGILFDIFQLYLNKKVKNTDQYKNILIEDDFYTSDIDNVDKKELSNLMQLKITDLLDSFSLVSDTIYLALGREINYLEGVLEVIRILLDNSEKQAHIKIVTYNEKRGGLFLEFTQLNIGKYLEKHLWGSLQSCVVTSATLSIGDDFNYIKSILHLEDFSFSRLESDFNYSKQALLFIPDDLGSIKNNLTQVMEFLLQLFLIVKGNTLVLFTAFYAIKECHSHSIAALKKEKISLYAQSIGGGKHKLIEAFKKHADSSILIGTDTFWEGIDIPGDDLKYLIIHKIPFMVPSDPIFQARGKLFSNAFMGYGVPKSILKLKQGFGRLIRNKTDTGIVIFLDDRIYSTRWGEELYKAFPSNIVIKKVSSNNFLNILENKKNS